MKSSFAIFFLFLPFFTYAYGDRTADSEKIISSVCTSTAPVLVVDNFSEDPSNELIIDLNGDGAYDIFHGELVSRIAELNGQEVIRANVGTPIYIDQLVTLLNSYADKIENDELNISWINFSQGFPLKISGLNKLIDSKNLVTDLNVHQYSKQILEALWTKRPNLKIKEMYNVFMRLEKLSIPVIVAAGNSGFEEINIYSLFPNVISVGALDLNLKKTGYSSDNSTVTVWRQGNIKAYAVPGGIDISGDFKFDFSINTPVMSPQLLKSLKGKNAEKIAKKIPRDIDESNDNNNTQFIDLISKLPTGLYSTQLVLSKALATSFQQSRYIASLGDYFFLDGIHPAPIVFVHVNTDGNILIEQGTDSPNGQLRNVLYGTSFSSPNICNGQLTPEDFSL